jgi:diphosphomevalonate decarboxylase
MKKTAIAPANIAFIKFWGKKDAALRLPHNSSISMNLSGCMTTTTVEFSPDYKQDAVTKGFDTKRVIEHIDRLRELAGVQYKAHVETKNSFPSSAGIASSASGFAALTVAASAALGLKLSEKELTACARLGSGSSCRSVPDGFVKWKETFAYSLYPPDYWDLRDILVIIDTKAKKVPTSEGHEHAKTSPYFEKRLDALPARVARCERALKNKDIRLLGEVIEEDCLDMHRVMQTQNPPLYYWNDETMKIMHTVQNWRTQGILAYYTIDAGPNVHIICEADNVDKVVKFVGREYQVIINKPSCGARVI